jgi:NAD(P)-dependent dehydrogenase (short-subunit alcohol dehydrogenase family)
VALYYAYTTKYIYLLPKIELKRKFSISSHLKIDQHFLSSPIKKYKDRAIITAHWTKNGDPMNLSKKVIVITGSTRGIGRAIADACATAGGTVVICSRNQESVRNTVNAIKGKGYLVSGIETDVSVPEDLKKLFDHAIEKHGKIDVWINNAGLSGGFRYIYDIPDEEIQNIINVNVTGLLLASKLILPYFAKQGSGILINLSGRGGRGEVVPYMVPYTSSKAAVISLTRSLAKEYDGKGISVTSLSPGMVRTDFYKDMKVSKALENRIKIIPKILDAFGVPAEKVGIKAVEIAAQPSGKYNGKQYTLMTGGRMMKAMGTMMKLRFSGQLKTE